MNLSSNRINQNTPRNARSAPNRAPVQKAPTQQANTLSNYGTTTRIKSISIGQIVKGEVTDLRNTEVVVTLEDNTIVAGKLENGNWLAIGETAAFRVLSASQEAIVLEALPKSNMALANSTIQKALEEAGFPKNQRNQQIVLELMKNQLPIHKQGIQSVLQQVLQHKDIEIPTLVLMQKHHIPITTENAVQLEHYMNREHSIATQLKDFSQNLTSYIKNIAQKSSAEVPITADRPTQQNMPAVFGTSPKDILLGEILQKNNLQPTLSPQEHTGNGLSNISRILSAILDSQTTNYTPAILPDATLQLPDNASKTELLSILENFQIPEELANDIQNNTASLREVTTCIKECYEIATKPDQQNLSEADIATNELSAPPPQEATVDTQILLRTATFDNPVIHAIRSSFKQLQQENKELGGFLSTEELSRFSEIIDKFPLDNRIKNQVEAGTIRTTDLLRTLKNVLPFTEQPVAGDLLTQPVFHEILEKEFTDAFMLTPKEIIENGGVDTYYRKLSRQLDELENLFDKELSHKNTHTINQLQTIVETSPKEQLQQLNDNLNFMKLLNQFFSYVQLPVKLKDKCTHADLYVYTNKKKLAENKNSIHILLHLDMDSLGALDIDLLQKSRELNATFITNDPVVEKLLNVNLPLLEDNLLQKGFLCTSKVKREEKHIDIIKDFIEPERSSSQLSRYSFDLRA